MAESCGSFAEAFHPQRPSSRIGKKRRHSFGHQHDVDAVAANYCSAEVYGNASIVKMARFEREELADICKAESDESLHRNGDDDDHTLKLQTGFGPSIGSNLFLHTPPSESQSGFVALDPTGAATSFLEKFTTTTSTQNYGHNPPTPDEMAAAAAAALMLPHLFELAARASALNGSMANSWSPLKTSPTSSSTATTSSLSSSSLTPPPTGGTAVPQYKREWCDGGSAMESSLDPHHHHRDATTPSTTVSPPPSANQKRLKFSISSILQSANAAQFEDSTEAVDGGVLSATDAAAFSSFFNKRKSSSTAIPLPSPGKTLITTDGGGFKPTVPNFPNDCSPENVQNRFPAWIFCTRYSDRPSSGTRSRKTRRKSATCSGNHALTDSAQSPVATAGVAGPSMPSSAGDSKDAGEEEKRPRTAFTAEQLDRLRRQFVDSRYLTEKRRQELAHELGLNESQIKIWFQNKRAKLKKTASCQQRSAVNTATVNGNSAATALAIHQLMAQAQGLYSQQQPNAGHHHHAFTTPLH